MWIANGKCTACSYRARVSKMAAGIAAFCILVSLCRGSVHADTPTGAPIFLYDGNHQAVNVSSQYTYDYQDPHVYSIATGNPIGMVVIGGAIEDAYGQQIGYIGGL